MADKLKIKYIIILAVLCIISACKTEPNNQTEDNCEYSIHINDFSSLNIKIRPNSDTVYFSTRIATNEPVEVQTIYYHETTGKSDTTNHLQPYTYKAGTEFNIPVSHDVIIHIKNLIKNHLQLDRHYVEYLSWDEYPATVSFEISMPDKDRYYRVHYRNITKYWEVSSEFNCLVDYLRKLDDRLNSFFDDDRCQICDDEFIHKR